MSLVRHGNLLPRESSRHREAAFALYRALLLACRAVPGLSQARSQQLQNVVRNRFKENIHNHSQRWLRLRFVAGYQGIDVLDAACAGDESKQAYLVELLDRTPSCAKEPPPPANAYSKQVKRCMAREEHKEKQAKIREQAPPKRSIFDRPLPREQLTGRRHVPVLFNANSIPVLRIKKPIPPGLSAYLANRIKKKQSVVDEKTVLAQEFELAKHEDKWDLITSHELSPRHRADKDRSRWTDAVQLAEQKRAEWLLKEKASNIATATKMQEIVDKEKRLREQEKDADAEKRRTWLRQRWLARQKEAAARSGGAKDGSI